MFKSTTKFPRKLVSCERIGNAGSIATLYAAQIVQNYSPIRSISTITDRVSRYRVSDRYSLFTLCIHNPDYGIIYSDSYGVMKDFFFKLVECRLFLNLKCEEIILSCAELFITSEAIWFAFLWTVYWLRLEWNGEL